MSDALATSVNSHYGEEDLIGKILSALDEHGFDIGALNREDLESFEEFHIRGRAATDEMIELAGLVDGLEILDVGCGIGGPARSLAAACDCHVTGIDLTQEFITAAKDLSTRCGMEEQNTFVCGSATDMPFDEDEFELVWLQHVNMNIPNKLRLFSECHRVLRPGGKLALYEIFAGSGKELEYPVPWANEAAISHLETADNVRELITGAGMKELVWNDVTEQATEWFENLLAGPPPEKPKLTLSLITGGDFRPKALNVLNALNDGRLTVGQGVYRK